MKMVLIELNEEFIRDSITTIERNIIILEDNKNIKDVEGIYDADTLINELYVIQETLTNTLKEVFVEYLDKSIKDVELTEIWNFTDEHFQNLLSFEDNKENFLKFIEVKK
jgi:hypothetical protein